LLFFTVMLNIATPKQHFVNLEDLKNIGYYS